MPKKHLGVSKDAQRNTWEINTRFALPDGSIRRIHKRGFASERIAFEQLEVEKYNMLQEYESQKRFFSWTDGCMEFWNHYKTKIKMTTSANAFVIYNKYIIEPFKKLSIEKVCCVATLSKFKTSIVNYHSTADYKNRLLRFMRWTIEFNYNRGRVTADEFKIANLELEPVAKNNEVKKERPIWSIDEFKRFIDSFDDRDKYKVLFEVFGHLGCRVSELRGLQVKHFNPERKEISIRQQVTSKLHNGSWAIVPPKTTKSIRTVIVSDRINKLLSEYINDLRLASDDFIFFGSNPVGESSIRRELAKHCKLAKVTTIPIHSLRHSNATWLLSNKNLTIGEIAKISQRLGHNSKKVTLDIYYHINNIDEDKILDCLI